MPLVDHHPGALEGPPNPGEGHRSVGSPRCDDGEQRVGLVDAITDTAVGVDPHAGADGERQQRHTARRDGEPVVGILRE